jgi:hypothetical protein
MTLRGSALLIAPEECRDDPGLQLHHPQRQGTSASIPKPTMSQSNRWIAGAAREGTTNATACTPSSTGSLEAQTRSFRQWPHTSRDPVRVARNWAERRRYSGLRRPSLLPNRIDHHPTRGGQRLLDLWCPLRLDPIFRGSPTYTTTRDLAENGPFGLSRRRYSTWSKSPSGPPFEGFGDVGKGLGQGG